MPELEHVFKHALVHDVAYESILLQQRRDLHLTGRDDASSASTRTVSTTSSACSPFSSRTQGEWAKAREYLIKAGDQAVRIAADAEALALYREAFAARERAFGEAWERAERGVLRAEDRERRCFAAASTSRLSEHLERSLSYLGRPFPRTRSAVRLAVLGHALRQAGHRLTPIFFRAKPVRAH